MSSSKEVYEKQGAAPAVGIVLFGLLFLFVAIPYVGPYISEQSFHDLHEAETDSGGGGGGGGHGH